MPKHRPWIPEDVDRLVSLSGVPLADVARLLGRSVSAVTTKRWRIALPAKTDRFADFEEDEIQLALRRHGEGRYFHEIASELGTTLYQVKKLLRSRGLVGQRWRARRHGEDKAG